jgi:hypothetical protein
LVISTSANTFLQRARLEAERYGADPWVFVRELLQNARDAGAHRVWFEVSQNSGRERISCRDDGSGMDFEHAQRYLFSLYASSKRGRTRSAGKFGIGFWSVLRFEPDEIVIRSQAQWTKAWEVRLDDRLEGARVERTILERGTEILLERAATADDLERQVESAILRDAPYLHCRHRVEHPVEVRVNGRLVRAEPALPSPSLSFRRRGLRGAVGLGPEPKAEIFAHGLRVRDAPTLDELLVETRGDRQTLTGSFEGLAPRVVIDSRELEVLMARGDAKEDRALRRMVRVGQRELGRLVRAVLDRHAKLSPLARIVEHARELWSVPRMSRIAAGVLLAVAVVALAWSGARWLRPTRTRSADRSASKPTVEATSSPYRNLWESYRGPDVDSVGQFGAAVDLRYRPADGIRHFGALWILGIRADGSLISEHEATIGSYEGAPCADGCLEIDLVLEAPKGLLTLPIATGHLVDPLSVELDGRRLPVEALATGQPAIPLDEPRTGRLHYRSGPGPIGATISSQWPELPAEVADFVRENEALKPAALAAEVTEYVSRRIAYGTSDDIVAEYRRATRRSEDLFNRALAIGAGDCDIQNSLVAAMLDFAGTPSRLAVGWMGLDGRVMPGLHAWVEYQDEGGNWRTADASVANTAPSANVSALAQGRHPTGSGAGPKIFGLAVGASALLASVAVMAFLRAGVWHRRLREGGAEDVLGLLRGAAVRPRAFEAIHSVSSRRVLRLLGGRSISLSTARRWATKGCLASGTSRCELARDAASGGGIVLDLEQPEAAAVADVLAAVNLDRWQRVLDNSEAHELTARVEASLGSAGEPCRIVVADLEGSEMAVLDGACFGLGAGALWIVLDRDGVAWRMVHRLAGPWPARAALLLADIVVNRVGSHLAVKRRCLSPIALDALREACESEA